MRKATPFDLMEILEMVVDYYIENQSINHYDVAFDMPKARAYVSGLLHNPDGICYMADDGVVLGDVTEPWFSKRKFARGWVLYVRPKARNGILARALLNKFYEEAKARGAFVSWDFYNDTHKEVINGLMRKLGYKENGYIFTKDTKEGSAHGVFTPDAASYY